MRDDYLMYESDKLDKKKAALVFRLGRGVSQKFTKNFEWIVLLC